MKDVVYSLDDFYHRASNERIKIMEPQLEAACSGDEKDAIILPLLAKRLKKFQAEVPTENLSKKIKELSFNWRAGRMQERKRRFFDRYNEIEVASKEDKWSSTSGDEVHWNVVKTQWIGCIF